MIVKILKQPKYFQIEDGLNWGMSQNKISLRFLNPAYEGRGKMAGNGI